MACEFFSFKEYLAGNFMFFLATWNVKIDVRLTSGKLDCLSEMKVLGIVFDDRLTWQNQTEKTYCIATSPSMKPSLQLHNEFPSRSNFKKVNTSFLTFNMRLRSGLIAYQKNVTLKLHQPITGQSEC